MDKQNTLKAILSEDIALLTDMYLELIEDTQNDEPKTPEQTQNAIKKYIQEGEKPYVFSVEDRIVGYAIVDPKKTPVYCRHFHILRTERKKGYGSMAFYRLLEALNVQKVDINVFAWNERARLFWASLGFVPRIIGMRYDSASQTMHDHDQK